MKKQKMDTPDEVKLIALHTCWLNADSIKARIRAGVLSSKEKEKIKNLPQELQNLLAFGKTHSLFLAISVWYALLYVVIEGYRELNLSNKEVDELLAQEEYVDLLRQFRNAIFHYQKNPISEKLLGFLTMKESEIWIRKLNSAFAAFFTAYPPINKFLKQFES